MHTKQPLPPCHRSSQVVCTALISQIPGACSYEAKLAEERETGLRLRGELGLLKKKAGTFQGTLEDVQAQLVRAKDLEASLHQVRPPVACVLLWAVTYSA